MTVTPDYDDLFQLVHENRLDDRDVQTNLAPAADARYESTSKSRFYPKSVRFHDGTLFGLVESNGSRALLCFARSGHLPRDIGAAGSSAAGFEIAVLEPGWESFLLLRERFPFTAPVSLREQQTTIGTGDRLGRATPGHIRAVLPYPVSPVLAQQSVRELVLTKRTYRDVVADAAFGVFQEGFESGYGADGDHLKTIADIDVALDAAMPMITLDLTEVMDPSPAEWSTAEIESRFAQLDSDTQAIVEGSYADKSFDVEGEAVSVPRGEARRCALMYWRALDFAVEVDRHLRERRGDSYDLEISIDETTAPTLPSHHLFIARELSRRGVTVNSVAPRFIGEFQKGIDYIGDLGEFVRQFRTHCRIARSNGDYKVSIHSGSDKFAVYPSIGEHTNMRVHVKTAGTSWLEAIRTISAIDPALYRLMHRKAFDHFEEATKLYHITADLARIANLETVSDSNLPEYLQKDESRQLLHITYGGLLNDPDVRSRFFEFLDDNEESYYDGVGAHIERHIRKLGISA